MKEARESAGTDAVWWGEYDLEPGAGGLWRIDPLELTIERREREWRLATSWQDETEDADGAWTVDRDAQILDDSENLQRYAFARTAGPLRVFPAVADRPVVTSPRIPLFLPPGEQVTLYVGAPLWVRVDVGPQRTVLTEVPIRRPSDTWFGPSTREGEICYATRTRAIVDLENLPLQTRRAITPLLIENHAPTALPVERLKLPVPYLSIWAAPDGRLWTPTVTMIVREGAEMASFDVGEGPADELGAVLLSEAREHPEPGVLIRAFSLFQASGRED